jgi:hypothetical protein
VEEKSVMATEISNPNGIADGHIGCGFVEVLNDARDARPFGYKIAGARPGPTVVVAGYAPVAHDIFDRLLNLPTLPWLRGSLVLISLDALDVAIVDEELANQIGHVDRTLHLPFSANRDHATATREGYWAVLKLCAQLGMISGRGVNLCE